MYKIQPAPNGARQVSWIDPSDYLIVMLRCRLNRHQINRTVAGR